MTEDEHLAPAETTEPRRPLVQWQRTGRTRERSLMFGAFAVGMLVGALLVGGTLERDRVRELWS